MRCPALDGLRGLFLLLMTWAHLQASISSRLGGLNHHRLGFADAAHGFVALSGVVVGLYFSKIASERGESTLWPVVRKRLWIIYAFHAATAATVWFLAQFFAPRPDVVDVSDWRMLVAMLLLRTSSVANGATGGAMLHADPAAHGVNIPRLSTRTL